MAKLPNSQPRSSVPFELQPEGAYNSLEKELAGYDEAWAKAALFFRTGHRLGHKQGSVRLRPLHLIVEELTVRRQQLEAGDTLAVLHAIKLCAEENLPLPTWLAQAFVAALDTLMNVDGKSMSLDEAFHSPGFNVGTRKKAAQVKQDWRLGIELYGEVGQIARFHVGLDPAIRQVLAARSWGVSITKAKKLVKMVDESQSSLTGGQVRPLSQVWAKRRKD